MLLTYYACSLLYFECPFCFTYQTQLDLRHGSVYLVIIDREFNDSTPFDTNYYYDVSYNILYTVKATLQIDQF